MVERVVRLGDVLGVLSLVGDLGMGQPMEHALLQTMVALRLGEQLGLEADDRTAISCGGLLAWVGCHVDSYEQAKWFGDEAAAKAAYGRIDIKNNIADLAATVRLVGYGGSIGDRIRSLRALLADFKEAERTLATHSAAVDSLAASLDMDDNVRKTIAQHFERWDGRGPIGTRGETLLPTARVIVLADVAVAHYRIGGVDAARDVARRRSGTQFDPAVADLFCRTATEIFDEFDGLDLWNTLIDSERALRRPLGAEELDRALEAIADFTDVKSPFTIGHSRGVADLAGEAARDLGSADPTAVRRAGLVHDLGRLGISNSIWDRPGALSHVDQERVRMHPYLSERALASAAGLAELGAIAVEHHERMDGSGYPRGLAGGSISQAGRLLAAADVYHAVIEPRPHRPAGADADAAACLRSEVQAGRLDGDAATAVLRAAGHKVGRRRDNAAGLTRREIEILGLLARGMSTRDIAAQLWITRKTAQNHIEHIYAKLGVNSRALVSLKAAQLGLIGGT